jgi:hypothetical protein
MLSFIGYLLIGVVIGIVLMIVISVLVVSGRQSDAEYRHDLEEYENTVEGSEGLSRDDK